MDNVKYGCPSHRYRQMIEFTLIRFQEQLKIRLTEIQRQTTGLEDLRKDRRLLQATANRPYGCDRRNKPPRPAF